MAQSPRRAGSETKLPAAAIRLISRSERSIDAAACLLSTRGDVRNAAHC